ALVPTSGLPRGGVFPWHRNRCEPRCYPYRLRRSMAETVSPYDARLNKAYGARVHPLRRGPRSRESGPGGTHPRVVTLGYCVTAIFAAKLGVPPMVTTTGCGPAGTPLGMTKLICSTPTDQLGIPT